CLGTIRIGGIFFQSLVIHPAPRHSLVLRFPEGTRLNRSETIEHFFSWLASPLQHRYECWSKLGFSKGNGRRGSSLPERRVNRLNSDLLTAFLPRPSKAAPSAQGFEVAFL